MIKKFLNSSIKFKIMVVVLVTSSVVLVLASIGFFANEAISFWQVEREKLLALADIIGKNSSAAITFNDNKSAADTLEGLSLNPHILSAYIITKDNKLFAKYIAKGLDKDSLTHKVKDYRELIKESNSSTIRNLDYDIEIVKPVFLDNQLVATIVIQSDTEELLSKLMWLLFIVTTIMGVTLFVAYLISLKLQRLITDPILHLAQTMKVVSEEKNYSVRAKKENDDELGVLIAGFNEMLEQIQGRDEKLKQHSKKLLDSNERLEKEMAERKQVEESLRESEEKFRNLAASAQDAIIMMDNDGKISYFNEAAERIFGYTSQEIIGGKIHSCLIPEKYRQDFENGFSYFKEKGLGPLIGKIIELNALRRDGTEFQVEFSISGVKIKGKWEAIGIFRDVTERKKLEDQLRQSQKMEVVGQLAGGVAHDFNNILTAIIGYGEILKTKMGENNPLKDYATQVITSGKRAADLTHSLLAFSRKQIINSKPVNLNEIINNVKKLLLRVIGEDVELKTILTDKSLNIKADSVQIEQVLMNLATNARHAMPKGGHLIISTGLVELDKKFLKKHDGGEPGMYALVSVSDTGAGMDEKTKERIFEPFFTTKEVGKGTGLGLSMVYGTIKQHNGYINCYSELNKGTTFKIYLPILGSNTEVLNTQSEPSNPQLLTSGTETVLVAEDYAGVRELTKSVLEESGYKVMEAVDGEDAIKRFTENKDKIQLLLFDLIMPKKNGKEAYEEIKKICPDIKAIFTSGYTADIIHEKDLLKEGLHFVSKPILPSELLRKVREVLDKGSEKSIAVSGQ